MSSDRTFKSGDVITHVDQQALNSIREGLTWLEEIESIERCSIYFIQRGKIYVYHHKLVLPHIEPHATQNNSK